MIRVALFGFLANSTNLGCQALTYAGLLLLERVSNAVGLPLAYTLYEYSPDRTATTMLQEATGIEAQRLAVKRFGNLSRTQSARRNLPMLNGLRSADVVIDITSGDSFTDAYGSERFRELVAAKQWALRLKRPLILAPQTYGPFLDPRNETIAMEVVSRARLVLSRDNTSARYLMGRVERSVLTTTDVAVALPYQPPPPQSPPRRIKIGLNPSGLLLGVEPSTSSQFRLSVDYPAYIRGLLGRLVALEHAEVYLVPHVYEDYTSSIQLAAEFPQVRLVGPFDSPIRAKTFIAGLDVLLGSRMHATIASLTSGVPTVPVAYSPKFAGFFETLGYTETVDLAKLRTAEALAATAAKLERLPQLREQARASAKRALQLGRATELALEEEFSKIASERSR